MTPDGLIATYILVLIYTGMSMHVEPRNDLIACVAEARSRIGEPLDVKFWDNMNGSNPIPTVHTAFCVQGGTIK